MHFDTVRPTQARVSPVVKCCSGQYDTDAASWFLALQGFWYEAGSEGEPGSGPDARGVSHRRALPTYSARMDARIHRPSPIRWSVVRLPVDGPVGGFRAGGSLRALRGIAGIPGGHMRR